MAVSTRTLRAMEEGVKRHEWGRDGVKNEQRGELTRKRCALKWVEGVAAWEEALFFFFFKQKTAYEILA